MIKIQDLIMAIATCFLLSLGIRAQDDQPQVKLDPNLPYQAERFSPVTYDVDFSIVVTPPYKTKSLKVWLPIPQSDTAQEVSESKLSTFPQKVESTLGTESKYGNRFAFFEFESPQGAQVIRHQFRVTCWELRWNLDAARIHDVKKWPESFNVYRESDSQSVIVDERFRSLLAEIAPKPASQLSGFRDVMSWVQDNVEYDHADASLRADATHVLNKRRGHCSDYHSFCASLGRSLGVPTRVTYGINAFPKNSPSHCKLEAYLAPYGWVSFDVSETQKLVADIRKSEKLNDSAKDILASIAMRRLQEGFRDNTWFLQTRGTDYELAPKASKRVSVVRTAYIEADGVPLPEPDPANKSETKFSWMTVHEYRPNREVKNPFSDWASLQEYEKGSK